MALLHQILVYIVLCQWHSKFGILIVIERLGSGCINIYSRCVLLIKEGVLRPSPGICPAFTRRMNPAFPGGGGNPDRHILDRPAEAAVSPFPVEQAARQAKPKPTRPKKLNFILIPPECIFSFFL
jgi:hypothetical protein